MIWQVNKGNKFLCPLLAKRRQARARPAPGVSRCPPLHRLGRTSRELEVLQLIAEGKANKETAAEHGINPKTIEKHREHLMAKLGLHDTASLTRYAISAGVIESRAQVTIV